MFVDTGVRMPISRAILAMLRVPTLMPTSAKTELSEWVVAPSSVVIPE